MKKSITPNLIKENNRNLIYQYIYKNKDVSQQDISYALRLSRPTITTKLNELENEGLITKNGQISSDYVGRKASAYAIVPDYRISIGIELLKEEVKMIAIDLYGEKVARDVYSLKYENKDSYYKKLCEKILAFIQTYELPGDRILGIGIAMQALVSADGARITYGKILSCTGLSIDALSKYLPYPCSFIHDANSAAISEMWVSPELSDAFYLSLSHHLGAAVISDGRILTGKHGHSSTIEHIQVNPKGKVCYCGKHGCMETLCSMNALLADGESPEAFFTALRDGNQTMQKRWNSYLKNLAGVINTLHLVNDTDFILGGYLASYLVEEDIRMLYDLLTELTPFEEPCDFILISKMPTHNITIGAGLPYIQAFLKELTD